MFRAMLRPGQGFQHFVVLEKKGGLSDNGRFQIAAYTPVGEVIGLLTLASQGEAEQWRGKDNHKQDAHTFLYKIIQRGGGYRAKATDVLSLEDGKRQFLVKGVDVPGDFGFFAVYFAQEREDFQ